MGTHNTNTATHSHHSHHPVTLGAILVTLGIVFGDIGTSPLYVLKAIVGEQAVTRATILGGLSCIFWTLTFQTTIKYVWLALKADNHGEGGTLSLYALVRRKKKWLYIPAILGASMLLADGMITPPISIVSAIEGITTQYATNGLMWGMPAETFACVIASIILLGLFGFQWAGTNAVGKAFGPIMFVWFSVLGLVGVYNLLPHLEILQAINPYYAFEFLRNSEGAFLALGAVFLCTTGAEALYSDLGHCGRKNIEIAWVFVKICLILNYFGQGAWLLGIEGSMLDGRIPFYAAIDHISPALHLPAVALATLAAIIASQALISGSYTLISSAITLNLWPKIKIHYPSDLKGQIYIPSINWLLFTGCLAIVWGFKSSTAMEAIYGLAITLTMLMDTVLLSFYLRKIKHASLIFTVLIISTFFIIESAFLGANLSKLMHGGFVTLLLGGFFSLIMLTWYNARRIKNFYNDFVHIDKKFVEKIKALSSETDIPKYATNLVYLTSADNMNDIEAKIEYSIFNKKPKRADIYWFVHVHYTDSPYERQASVHILEPEKIVRVEFRLGFKVQPRINRFLRQVIDKMTAENLIDINTRYESLKKHNIKGDFRFVVIDRVLNYDYTLGFWQQLTMNFFAPLKSLSLSEEKAFGLDTSMVTVETMPLIVGYKAKKFEEERENRKQSELYKLDYIDTSKANEPAHKKNINK